MSTPTLTETSYIVLGLIEWLGEASPYDLKQRMAVSVGTFWSLPHSQLYRTTEKLAADGLLDFRTETTRGGRSKRIFGLTAEGAAALERWRSAPGPTDLPELRDPALLRVFFGADPRPIARAQLAARRERLAVYERQLAFDDGSEPRGPWLALEAGIALSKVWIEYWERLADRGGSD